MAYKLKYRSDFDGISYGAGNESYHVEILGKDYAGPQFSLTSAGTPLVHTWNDDDPHKAVRGSSVQFSFLSQPGVNIKSFYSDEDDYYKLRIYWGAQLMFEGFIVQDDMSELNSDSLHVITVTANDNLGLLKDVSLSEAAANITTKREIATIRTLTSLRQIEVQSFTFSASVGNTILILGTSSDGAYVVSDISYPSPGIVIVTFLTSLSTLAPVTATMDIIGDIKIDRRVSLLDLVSICIRATNVPLQTFVYTGLQETSHNSTASFLSQTMIDPATFLISDKDFDNCYNVLEKVMGTFGFSVFQAFGQWNIIRWAELRLYPSQQVEGFAYDASFAQIGAAFFQGQFVAGVNDPLNGLNGLLNRVFRLYKSAKRTFNYAQPNQLIKNIDFRDVGTLIRDYVSGSFHVYEYQMPDWTSLITHPTFQFFIRVVNDSLGNEYERYAVMKGEVQSPAGFTSTRAVASSTIEAQKGDKITVSFSTRGVNFPAPGAGDIDFTLLDDNGSLGYILYNHSGSTYNNKNLWHLGGSGVNGYGVPYATSGGLNPANWFTVEMEGDDIPFDGLVNFFLSHFNNSTNPNRETHVKDIRVEYIPYINQSTKIIGHTHTQSQNKNVKNKEDVDISIDDSPRNSIAGCLFLKDFNGNVKKRTQLWHRGTVSENKKLAEITTYETLFYRRVTRDILEGQFIGLTQSGAHVSLLACFKYSQSPGLNFVPGRMEIDYKNNRMNCTLWEEFKDLEVDADLVNDYDFDYKYQTN